MAASATVDKIMIYPVKSCQAVELDEASVTAEGFYLDRCFIVVGMDEESEKHAGAKHSMDMRVKRRLAAIKPTLSADLSQLTLEVDQSFGLPTLTIPTAFEAYQDSDVVIVADRHDDLWFGSALQGRSAGMEADSWITTVLNFFVALDGADGDIAYADALHKAYGRSKAERYGLVRYDPASRRRLKAAFGGKSMLAKRAKMTDTTAFSDGHPFHLVSTESLDLLNEKLDEKGRPEVTIHRFRPNIVVSGVSVPNEEDGWAEFSIMPEEGEPTFMRQTGNTARCVIPTTNPFTGVRDDDEEPRATLAEYRPMPYGDGPHGGPTFGVWLACDTVGSVIKVGDSIFVSEVRDRDTDPGQTPQQRRQKPKL